MLFGLISVSSPNPATHVFGELVLSFCRKPVGTLAAVSVALLELVMCPFPSVRRRLSLAMSLPLPRFTTKDVAPDTAQSLSVATSVATIREFRNRFTEGH